MTIKNEINTLSIKAEVLYKTIEEKSSISSLDAFSISSLLLQLREESQSYLLDHIIPRLDLTSLSKLGTCRKLLYKSQAKLFKKIDPSILKSSKFHEHVSQVWAKISGIKNSTKEFGEQFSLKFPKDSVTLEGLVQFLMPLGGKKDSDLLHTTLPKSIATLSQESTISEKEALETKPSNTLLKQQPNKTIKSIEEAQCVTKTPIIHHELNTAAFLNIKLILDNEFYRKKFQKHLLKTQKIELPTQEALRDYLYHNANHPFINNALLDIQLKCYLEPFLDVMEEFGWPQARAGLAKLTPPLKTVLLQHFAEKNQVNPTSSNINLLFLSSLQKPEADPNLIQAITSTIKSTKNSLELNPIEAPVITHKKFFAFFTIGEITKDCQNGLCFAYEALAYSVRKVITSANYFNREEKNLDLSIHPSLDNLAKFLAVSRQKIIASAMKDYIKKRTSSKNEMVCSLSDRVAIEQFPIGNCGELTNIAFEYLARMHKDLSVEIIHIPSWNNNGDHVFLLIDRDSKSDLNDHTTWGNKAVILDCWTRMIYPASEIIWLLQNWKGTDFSSGLIFTSPYNFQRQELEIIVHNVMPYSFYKDNQGLELPSLEKKLNEFHIENNPKKKSVLANDCLEILDQQGIQQDIMMETLRSQLHFYLFSKLPKLPEPSKESSYDETNMEKEEIEYSTKTFY